MTLCAVGGRLCVGGASAPLALVGFLVAAADQLSVRAAAAKPDAGVS